MVRFSELSKYRADTQLVISARHEAWLKDNPNPTYSKRAVKHAEAEFRAQANPRDRRGTVSGSSLGKCKRRQQFTFLGMPELPPSAKTAQIFQNGFFMHLRWQMAGITEGWLAAAEIPVAANPFRLSGTMDGIAYDGSVVEFKSCHTNDFSRVNSFGPLAGHEFQLATYVLTSDAEKGVFIYEDKNTQEFKEIVKYADELPLVEVAEESAKLWDANDARVLIEPLESCMAGERPYNSCQFKNVCMALKSWEEAENVAQNSTSN